MNKEQSSAGESMSRTGQWGWAGTVVSDELAYNLRVRQEGTALQLTRPPCRSARLLNPGRMADSLTGPRLPTHCNYEAQGEGFGPYLWLCLMFETRLRRYAQCFPYSTEWNS